MPTTASLGFAGNVEGFFGVLGIAIVIHDLHALFCDHILDRVLLHDLFSVFRINHPTHWMRKLSTKVAEIIVADGKGSHAIGVRWSVFSTVRAAPLAGAAHDAKFKENLTIANDHSTLEVVYQRLRLGEIYVAAVEAVIVEDKLRISTQE